MQTVIMPNPAKDIATLQFYAERSYSYSIQLVDITGKILLVKKVQRYLATTQKK